MSVLASRNSAFGTTFETPSKYEAEDGIDWGTATPPNAISFVHLDEKAQLYTEVSVKEKLPLVQKALLLHKIREPFALTEGHHVPQTRHPHELIVRIQAIGLNPVDWKSVDYGFGIPQLPYVSGRDFAGVIVQAPETGSDLQVGDTVS